MEERGRIGRIRTFFWSWCPVSKTHKEDRNRILGTGGLQSVSDSETDVTVNLSTFAELLTANDDGTKEQQKRVDGPQLRLGTEWRLRHA